MMMSQPDHQPLSDLEIAQTATLQPIAELAESLGLPISAWEPYGRYKAKLDSFEASRTVSDRRGKVVLISAISPTPTGEGKSTTTVGLADSLYRRFSREVQAGVP